jgi:hypothetical protein
MSNERWVSPFPHTIPYLLFIEHFTELNNIYWAHVPAKNTIEKKALESLKSMEEDPKKYFLIRDEDDRRLPLTYKEWKDNYRNFDVYTRLNMLMLLSSCFETYFRTIISFAFESKPGVIIDSPDSKDGIFLLKSKRNYGVLGSQEYKFTDQVESICTGMWQSRVANFNKYFGIFPISDSDILLIDEMRRKRNSVGHYFGRNKDDYEAPLSFFPEPIEPISHEKLLKYFKLVHKIVSDLDIYLKNNYLGSYDIIKYYFKCVENGIITGKNVGDHARELRKLLGSLGMRIVDANYYRNLIAYVSLTDEKNAYIYGKRASAKIVKDRLKERGVSLTIEERTIAFNERVFSTIINYYSIKDNSDYCEKRGREKYELFFSEKAIDFIVEKIVENPRLLETINRNANS